MKIKLNLLAICIALFGFFLTGAIAWAAIDVSGTVTYGLPNCEYSKHDYVALYDDQQQNCFDSRHPCPAIPHRYHLYHGMGQPGWYYLKWYTESIDQTCWERVYLSGTHVIDNDMCATCKIDK